MFVTHIIIEQKSLIIHDLEDDSSACGTLFRTSMRRLGWSFTWHLYGTQPNSNTCGFRVAMLTMQWCNAIQPTRQLPCWFFENCASILPLFAINSSTLCSMV